MTKRTKILSWTGIGLGFAMAMLGLYRMFTTDSPVGDALVKLGILLILFSRYLPEVEGRGKYLLVIAVNLAAVILVLTGTLLPGGRSAVAGFGSENRGSDSGSGLLGWNSAFSTGILTTGDL